MVEVALRPKTPLGHASVWQRETDWPIVIAAFALIGAGLMLSLAAGPPAANRLGYEDQFFFVKRQVGFAGLAAITLLGVSTLNAVWARRLAALVFAGSLVLLATILLVGHEAKGAQRWIRFAGFSLQPSEFAKPALVVLTGWLLAQRQLYPNGPWAGITLVFFCATLGFLLLQPDVGQAALLTAAFVVTFFVSGLPFRWAVIFAGGGAALSGLLYATLPHVRFRVNSFINPTAYDTYQIDKASEAIARGGLLGVGPGEGTIKTSLPDAHTDFIYAVMGEEFGYIAAVLLIFVFGFIVWRGLRAAARIHDPYPRAAASGLFALFGLQAAINIAVNVSLIPPKGMTLPFISYGGSSMLGTALTLGLALALIRRERTVWKG
ncbi:putative peptidoglycan glycosyltransferase FtsW [Hyphomonas sp. FCG-A18]|uniref:FtsW/RodA/SpoVE family cell cycle protein n=1 Tax=Hyphomonas sp. FCG-A18 TaxID=3080019 RepID=UPI002B2B97E2|nr:putative peptidoglycan glycosyltransferase FtsW [Hyphomonas sp. FCG-A18]